jgi:hypothetical protein
MRILRGSPVNFLTVVIIITISLGIVNMYPSSALSMPTPAATTNSMPLSKPSGSLLTSQQHLSSSSPPPTINVQFDTNTKTKDIIAIHNLGIPFDKYIAKVSHDVKSQTPTGGQLRAWNYIESLIKINTDICTLNQNHQKQQLLPRQQQQQQQLAKTKDALGIIAMMSDSSIGIISSLPPPPSKNTCDTKMSFAYEVCQGDPTIFECDPTQYTSKAINNYIKTNNLHDGTQTDNLAYEELENISATLNHVPDNTISDIVHFTNTTSTTTTTAKS